MAQRRTLMWGTAMGLAAALVIDPVGLSGLAERSAFGAEVEEDRASNLATAVSALTIPEAATSVPLSGEYALPETSGELPDLPATTPIIDEVLTPVTSTPTEVDLGGMDVTVTAVDASTPDEVQLNLLDGEVVAEAGVDGVVLSITADEALDEAEIDLTVDYSTFAGLKGSDWSSRLQMVYIPECAAITPTDPDCLLQPLDTVNDPDEATLSAIVPVEPTAAAPGPAALTTSTSASTSGGGRLAVIAGASGSGGDWGATTLAPSSSWSQTGNSGGFTWSYPMPVTIPAPGPAPQLNLTYSSSVSDGRTPMTNNQSGWIGEGFDLTTGYIERSFVACDDDQDSWAGRGQPNNHDRDSADLCWREDNATLVFQGASTELVKTGANTWVSETDDGTMISHETGGSDDYWKVTTVDGTVNYFGITTATETGTTGSAWTVPVYGNHATEPCHASTFANSDCRTVWRWNIDKVVDTLGNEMTYSYAPETNYYVTDYTAGLNRDATWYTSGGRLTAINYGTPASGSLTLGKVLFDSTARCLTSRTNGRALCDTLTPGVPDRNWPDTPKDLQCDEAEDCENYSPTFFNTTRLSSVRAQVLEGSTYRTTDTWAFAQEYVAQGGDVRDTTNLILTLEKVTHTAAGILAGQSAITLLPVVFGYSFDANRIDTPNDGHARLIRPRVDSILTESRGLVSVDYATDPECTAANKPRNPSASAQSSNTDFCYPVRWNPNRTKKTEVDWFHKYVVRSILEDGTPSSDPTSENPTELITGSLSKETFYEYDEAGWAKPSGPLIDSTDSDVTVSEFRGARTVSQRLGSADANASTRNTYYLGLGGNVTGGPSNGQSASDSRPEMAGQVYAGVAFSDNSSDGEVRKVSESLSVVSNTQTVTGVISGHNARRVQKANTYTYTYRRDGTLEQSTQTTTDYNSDAQPIRVTDWGSPATANDDVCTDTTYATLSGNKVSFPASVTTREVDCSTGTIVSRTGATYDAASGQTLTETTMVTSSKTVTNATYTYDTRGRVTKTVDADGSATDTAYTTNSIGQVTQIATTHPDPDGSGPTSRPVTRVHVDALTGVTTKTVDANGKETVGSYDALERLLSVRYPQHASAPYPSVEYAYETRSNGANFFVTRTLDAHGTGQKLAVVTYDGLLRPFQTQTDAVNTGPDRNWGRSARGRMFTHTLYDGAGRVMTELGPWLVSGVVNRTPIVAELAPPTRTDYVYDLAGRVITERFCVNTACNIGQEKWKTVTHYDGATTLVVPPAGGIPTASVFDRRGQQIKTIEYLRDNTSAATSYATIIALPKQTTSYTYDGAGQMVGMTDPAGSQWTYQFNIAGQQTSATDPDSGTTTTTYNDLGQVASRTDGRGQGVSYEYDKLGRTVKRFHSGSATPQATWAYDTAPGEGTTTTIGQLASSTRLSGGLTYTTTVLGYDAAYQPTGVRTILPTSTTLKALSGQSYDVGYTYMADGQVSSTTLPKVTRPDGATVMGKETVTTVYDGASMPHWQTGGFGWGTYVAESLFDAEGRPLAMDLGNTYGAVVTYEWEDGTGRLHELALDRERVDGTEIQLAYQYDDAGNVTSVIDEPANANVAGNVDAQCFRYDQLRRLKTMWTAGESECGTAPTAWSQVGGPAPGWTDFTYDTTGNRTSKTTRSASGPIVTTSTFGTSTTGPHRLLTQTTTGQSATTFTWDAAGNRTGRTQGSSTLTYTWDSEGELAGTAGGPTSVSNVYDAEGDRLVKFDGANVTAYLPGGMEVTSTSSTTVSATRWYTFAGKTVAYRTGNGLAGVTSAITDHQGSIVGTIHNTDWTSGVSRKRPDPFGGSRTGTSVTSQSRGFLGAIHDSNALVLLNARYLDSATGTFVSVDPLLDPLNPAQFNAYVYSGNNPVTWSDPSGMVWTAPVADTGDNRYKWTHKNSAGKSGASGGAGKATSTGSHSSTNGGCGYADWDCRAQAASEEVSCGGVGKGRYCKSTPGAGPWGYSYQYDNKLKLSKPTTAEQAMAAFQANPSKVFPFKVSGCDSFYTGAECVLETGATLNPNGTVGVTTTSTSVKFTVIARGYFDAPGSTIEFSTWSDDAGSTYLRQTASARGTSLDTMIAVGLLQLAKPTWEQQSANLGAVINEQR